MLPQHFIYQFVIQGTGECTTLILTKHYFTQAQRKAITISSRTTKSEQEYELRLGYSQIQTYKSCASSHDPDQLEKEVELYLDLSPTLCLGQKLKFHWISCWDPPSPCTGASRLRTASPRLDTMWQRKLPRLSTTQTLLEIQQHKPSSRDKCITFLESDERLDDHLCHRDRQWIFVEIPNQTC
jgi:hypothetical protein